MSSSGRSYSTSPPSRRVWPPPGFGTDVSTPAVGVASLGFGTDAGTVDLFDASAVAAAGGGGRRPYASLPASGYVFALLPLPGGGIAARARKSL